MKATGSSTRRVAGASSGTLMATFSRENGSMIKLMDMEFTFIKMALNTRATGKTISNMASERKYGPTAQNTRDITLGERSMERDCICGRMDPCTKANGSKIE